MSEISEMLPLVNALLNCGQMPRPDQVHRMLVIIDKQGAEIERVRGDEGREQLMLLLLG